MNGKQEPVNGSRADSSSGTRPARLPAEAAAKAGSAQASPEAVTKLLADWGHGDDAALEKLMPLVYEELRGLAHHYMEGQRPNHTLQTTALVNEAYLRLADQTNPRWQNRAHFFAVSARAMRQ